VATRFLLALLFAALGSPALAQPGDALRVQWTTRVAQGERPKLVLTANRAVGEIAVELADDSGAATTARVARLGAGGKHEVPLSPAPGRHHYRGKVTVHVGAGPAEEHPVDFETVVAPKLEVTIDRARVDLGAHRLEAKLSRPAQKVAIAVAPVGGGDVTAEQDLGGQAANTPLVIRLPNTRGEIARIDLRFHDIDGFYTGVALYPWKLYIPHEEVSFATDSASIAAAEQPKLEASLAKINDAVASHGNIGSVKLFIAGHTDTVGKPDHNLRLSRARAAAIATWFRKRGLRLPILWEGFGERALAVTTPDETNEVKNRRVDYILAVEEPALGGDHRPAWQGVR
jgi:outer membrane protein OmpA-like peptidoglycan-associated protein